MDFDLIASLAALFLMGIVFGALLALEFCVRLVDKIITRLKYRGDMK